MSDNKNIDRLFKEQFKDFEATPAAGTWDQIAAQLQHKKKRRVVPFWLKSSGIAAALVLGCFLLFDQNSTLELPQNKVATGKKTNPKGEPSLKSKTTISTKPDSEVVSAPPTRVTNQSIITNPLGKVTLKSNFVTNNTTRFATQNQFGTKNSLVQNDFQESEKNTDKLGNNLNNYERNLENESSIDPRNSSSNKTIANPALATTDSDVNIEKQIIPNELELLLQQKDGVQAVVTIEKSQQKWQIKPTVAPLFLNTNAGGSAIDPQFANNPKSAEQNLSYGVGVQYALNKKVKVRTGVNKLALDYNTKNIVYSTSLMSNNLPNITYTTNQFIEIKNENTLETLILFEKDPQPTTAGQINQQLGYIELPMELSYALLDNKWGINLIGGLSTLFLSQNKIAIVGEQGRIPLGEANNLNSVHFSSNVGVGFSYQIKPFLRFNFEPMMKYQFNTFSQNNSSFKPAFIGLYSGLSFSF